MATAERTTLPDRHVARRAAGSLGRGLQATARWVTTPLRSLVHWWRRSIQARVVIGVLSLSAVLALLAGWLLLHQVKDGLLVSQRQAALPQAAAGFDTARSRLNADDAASACLPSEGSSTTCAEFVTFLRQLVDVLSPHEAANGDYSVGVIGPLAGTSPERPSTWGPMFSPNLDVASSIPEELLAEIKTSGQTWSVYGSMRRTPFGPEQPALFIGRQIPVTSQDVEYALVYVFPLAEQQQTLSVVERGLLVAGLLLVILLGTIAWLVTRQVVTPVRLARRIAERLAAGRLEERMHVRGEDDIARLGQSFNQMANGLQRQIRQLEELSRVQRRFVADVSHELRTPLTTVRMASDLLYEARQDFDAPTARSAELLQNELDRFETLLTDLLEISRFDAGAAVLEVSDVDLSEVARQVVDAYAAIAERGGSGIVVNLPEEPATVQADVRRVQRIVRNLVSNALQYGEGNDVVMSVTSDDAMVCLTVRDHGVGLKPGEENLVFNRFWRADPARARTRGGTGLGLSIALEDTTLHGGVLDASGRRGHGSVFRLILPRRLGGRVVARQLTLDAPAPALSAASARLPKGGGES